MRFTEDFIERVLQANNLVDLLSEVTQLKSASGGYMGRCPFPDHREKTPSFSVSEMKQVYHCFGCGKSGNVFSFLRDYHGLGFPQAVEYLADRAHIQLPVPETTRFSDEDKLQQLRKSILTANRAAAEFFELQMHQGADDSGIRAYLQERRLSDDTVKQFQLGYAPAGWDSLLNFLVAKGVDRAAAEKAGLIRSRRESQGHYDMFRDRLMFPIRKISGEVIGFGGRIIATGEPKYLNSPESSVFAKGKTLYGLDQTARYIRSQDQVVIVEGYMDLVMLFQHGIKGVAATLGTALTGDHAHALGKMTKNVVILFDGDQAGQMASIRSLAILLKAGLRPRGIALPDQMDPDEFVQARGAEALQNEIDGARDLFSLVVETWTRDFRGAATETAALLESCTPLFQAMSDFKLRELYILELAGLLRMDAQHIRRLLQGPKPQGAPFSPSSTGNARFIGALKGVEIQERAANLQGEASVKVGAVGGATSVGGSASGGDADSSQQDSGQNFSIKQAPRAEKMLLGLVLRNRSNLESVLRWNALEAIGDPEMSRIFKWLVSSYRQDPAKFDMFSSLLTTQIDEPSMLNQIILADTASHMGFSALDADEQHANESETLRQCVKRLRIDALKKEIDGLRRELKGNPTAEGMIQLQELQKQRLEISAKEME